MLRYTCSESVNMFRVGKLNVMQLLPSKKSDGSVIGRARPRSDHRYVVDFLKIELNYVCGSSVFR